MFKVIHNNHLPSGLRLVGAGTLLGRWDTPIVFTLTSEKVSVPLFVNIIITKNGEGEEGKLAFGEIVGNQLTAKLKIKETGLPIGTKKRAPVVSLVGDTAFLTVSFILHTLTDSEFFEFNYEFYEEDMPAPASQEYKEGRP